MGDRTMTDDPYNPTTIGGWIRSFLLARQLRAGYADQAAIDRDYARLVAAEDSAAAAAWDQKRADGVPVAQPQTDPELPSAHVPAGPEPEPVLSAETFVVPVIFQRHVPATSV